MCVRKRATRHRPNQMGPGFDFPLFYSIFYSSGHRTSGYEVSLHVHELWGKKALLVTFDLQQAQILRRSWCPGFHEICFVLEVT